MLKKIPLSVWGFLTLIAITALPLFGHLGQLPIQMWDESRLAENALEMSHNNNWLITTWENLPDMWNTKPPFLIWLQAISIKLFGISELAVRIPSALAAFATCFLLYYVFGKKLNNYRLGLISVLVLVSSTGYVSLHGIRTGDYDSMLTLLNTLYCLLFFFYIEEKKPRYLLLTFFALALAVLTKSIAGLMAAPALVVYAIFRNYVLSTLKSKQFYIGLFSFLFLTGGFYLLREHYNPGYLKAVWENELGGRFAAVNEGHVGSKWFYYDMFINWKFKYWYLMVPCGIFAGMISKDELLKKLCLYSVLVSGMFFIVISSAKTKLHWYDMPLYPFLAIFVGIFIDYVFVAIKNTPIKKLNPKLNPLPYLFIFFIFLHPYNKVRDSVLHPTVEEEMRLSHNVDLLLRKIVDQSENAPKYFLSIRHQEPNAMWYKTVLSYKSVQLDYIPVDSLKPSQLFITCRQEDKDSIKKKYDYTILTTHEGAEIYRIDGWKKF